MLRFVVQDPVGYLEKWLRVYAQKMMETNKVDDETKKVPTFHTIESKKQRKNLHVSKIISYCSTIVENCGKDRFYNFGGDSSIIKNRDRGGSSSEYSNVRDITLEPSLGTNKDTELNFSNGADEKKVAVHGDDKMTRIESKNEVAKIDKFTAKCIGDVGTCGTDVRTESVDDSAFTRNGDADTTNTTTTTPSTTTTTDTPTTITTSATATVTTTTRTTSRSLRAAKEYEDTQFANDLCSRPWLSPSVFQEFVDYIKKTTNASGVYISCLDEKASGSTFSPIAGIRYICTDNENTFLKHKILEEADGVTWDAFIAKDSDEDSQDSDNEKGATPDHLRNQPNPFYLSDDSDLEDNETTFSQDSTSCSGSTPNTTADSNSANLQSEDIVFVETDGSETPKKTVYDLMNDDKILNVFVKQNAKQKNVNSTIYRAVYIEDTMDHEAVKFWKFPKPGSFVAIPFSYRNYATKSILEQACKFLEVAKRYTVSSKSNRDSSQQSKLGPNQSSTPSYGNLSSGKLRIRRQKNYLKEYTAMIEKPADVSTKH